MNDLPLVSVVVPTHNRSALLADCLGSLLALKHPTDRYEIIVVDAASTDDTPERARALSASCAAPVVRYLRAPSSDANSARNAGLAAARGDLIALIDDDVLVPPGWLSALADGAIQWAEADCLGGPVRPIFERRPPRTCPAHDLAGVRFDEGPASKQVPELWGPNMAVRRRALDCTGPFRVGLPFVQEWEWQQRLLRAGGRLVYLPQAWLWHRRRDADLRIGSMVREFFVRGYLKGALGPPIGPRLAVQRAVGLLAHAARRRCTRGLTESARQLGLACGTLARHRRRAYLHEVLHDRSGIVHRQY
jgi:glycosyltransferase involved in cell wall biosynthesis